MISILISCIAIIYAKELPQPEIGLWNMQAPITVTPLDSPDPCWSPEFWSKVE